MNSFHQLIDQLIQLTGHIAGFVFALAVMIEMWLRGELRQLGLSYPVQTIVLVAAACVLVVGSFRLLTGIIRIFATIVLLLVVTDLVMRSIPS